MSSLNTFIKLVQSFSPPTKVFKMYSPKANINVKGFICSFKFLSELVCSRKTRVESCKCKSGTRKISSKSRNSTNTTVSRKTVTFYTLDFYRKSWIVNLLLSHGGNETTNSSTIDQIEEELERIDTLQYLYVSKWSIVWAQGEKGERILILSSNSDSIVSVVPYFTTWAQYGSLLERKTWINE